MNKTGKQTFTAGFELFIIIVALIVTTYAWFSNNKEIEANEMVIKADAHYNLVLSLDEGQTWITEASLNLPGNFEFKHEITGNGINMYIPSNKLDDGTPVSFTTASNQTDYLEFSVMFKLAANVSIFLDSTSFVEPTVGTDVINLIGSDVERKSSSGDFSRDLIASSVRLAFIENTLIDGQYIMNPTANLVWAPNKNYEITCSDSCSADINSTSTQKYKYVEAADIPTVEQDVNNVKDVISASAEEKNAHGDPKITTIDVNENDGIKKITVRVWIEGNDRDNITALTGGLFKMNLQFSAIKKGLDNIAPVVIIGEGNTLDGYTSLMEYSKDNGLTWVTYQENNNPVFEEGDKVLVRKSETNDYFASTSTTIEF